MCSNTLEIVSALFPNEALPRRILAKSLKGDGQWTVINLVPPSPVAGSRLLVHPIANTLGSPIAGILLLFALFCFALMSLLCFVLL